MASPPDGMIALPAALVVSAGHVAAELIRRCHTAGQPVPAGVLSTMNALTEAIAVGGNNIGHITSQETPWMSIAEFANATGIPRRTIRYRAAAGLIAGAQKVGREWVIPSTART